MASAQPRLPVRALAEIGVALALAAALHLIPFLHFQMPQGGTVSLKMLPILIVAFRWGPGLGMLAGGAFGMIDFLLEPVNVHPVQVLLDYPVAWSLVGLAGVFRSEQAWSVIAGTALGASARFSAHWLSGVVWFGQFAPEGQPVWLYSLIYNATYIVPSAILVAVLAYPVLAGLRRGASTPAVTR